MYVYLPVQFIFSFCSNYCLLTFCIFLNIFLDLLYILCHAVFLAIKTNKKKKKGSWVDITHDNVCSSMLSCFYSHLLSTGRPISSSINFSQFMTIENKIKLKFFFHVSA